jgi:hypothetical protein
MGNIMTCKINADTSDGLKLESDTSGVIDIQDNGTTRLTIGDTIDIQGTELVLDADADTSIQADTDDRIDFKVSGTERFKMQSTGTFHFGSTGNETAAGDASSNVVFTSAGGANTTMKFVGNGNEQMDIYFVANPVNFTRIVGAASGSPVLIEGVGSDTNVGIRMVPKGSGGVHISGALSKDSGSFKIKHPVDSKKDSHYLVHSFIEGPQADLIYRGKVDLVAGSATINIDTTVGMTDGTFVALNTDIQCFTSNESGWTAVKGSVSGNVLTITAQDNSCTDTISWMVVGERQDQHMKDTSWTDSDGKVILEPEQEGDDVILTTEGLGG